MIQSWSAVIQRLVLMSYPFCIHLRAGWCLWAMSHSPEAGLLLGSLSSPLGSDGNVNW